MSSSANSTARTRPDALSSLISRLPDPQDRDWYADLVSYIQSLPPNDELVKVAQLFGFLTLVGRELPEALAAEQVKLREFLLKAYGALQQEVQTNGRYHEQLNERLNQLPNEIAAGVKPEAIAKAMSESFRQQLVATGIGDTKAFLTDAMRDLKSAAREVDVAVKPIAARYGTLAGDIETKITALTTAAANLDTTATAVDRKNAQLRREITELHWWVLPSVALALFLVGVFFGSGWEQYHATDAVLKLQTQVEQLQETIKALPAALAPQPASRKAKKNP